MTDQDAYKSIGVAEARAAVQASGLLEGVEGPLFLADNESEWLPYYVTRYDPSAHPLMAKVIVSRQGQKPREVVISWDEYASELSLNDPAWQELRAQKPMSIFGAEAERHGYRVVFADVLAPLLGPPQRISVQTYGQAEPDIITVWEPPREWIAEVRAADAVRLKELYDEAREAEALVKVEGLQAAFTERQIELAAAPKAAPLTVGPSPADMPKRKPEQPRPQGQGNRRRRSKR